MLISSALVLCLTILTATVFGQSRECGTVVTEEDRLGMEKVTAVVNPNAKRQTGNSYDFGIYFNVVASNSTESGGWVPQKQIDDQITLLNSRFTASETRIRFHLLNVTRIINPNWHRNAGLLPDDTENSLALAMKRSLHKGRSIHLNVYTVTLPGANGYSTLPTGYARAPALDGIVMKFTTFPGGSSLERQGGTLVHECGHWLGLLHTFDGGCTEPGDGVDDTPPEAPGAEGCPIGRTSCPNSNLPDPIHNFMDYTDESCRTEFTPGQVRRMHTYILAVRT